MMITHFLNRQAEALEHVLAYRTKEACTEPAHSRPTMEQFTIALAREVGTPAQDVAHAVGQRLGWAVYDRELPQMIARQLQRPAVLVEAIDERRQSWLLECLNAFNSHDVLSEGRYFRCLLGIIGTLGKQGRCVIVGHGAEFMLPPASTLRVRLVGHREDRIAALGRRLHLDRWSASERLEEIHRARTQFLREHFHLDPSKARHYDVVLNSSQWSAADCADFIVQALHHKASGYRTE
jgi:hypothetical protein